MATGSQALPPDPPVVGTRQAVRSRIEDGVTKLWPRVIPEEPRVVTFRGTGATFRIPGGAATTQNLFSIENATGSTVLVALRKLNVWSTTTVASVASPPWFSLSRITTMPTGGTTFTKTSVDSADAASNASVTLRQAASSDTAGAAITSAATGPRLATATAYQLVTAGNAAPPVRIELIDPELASDQPFILRAGEAYRLQVLAAATADNPTTRMYYVGVRWEEFTEF